MAIQNNPESAWFGDRPVNPDEKTSLVTDVFDHVADNYDLMNDVMSGGMHRLWKDRFVAHIRPRTGLDYLDLAGGTGDIAFRIHRATGGDAPITVCDLNPAMLAVGRTRAIDRGIARNINFVTGNAETLPFPDMSFDVVTIAFGLRNVTRIDTALADIFRVLKPGGRFYCLEFSTVNDAFLRRVYDAYSRHVIPRMGALVARDRDSYQYLVESIRKFPSQKELQARIARAGFALSRYQNYTAGVVAAHEGVKG